ncbi:unnamed protein product [Tuber aestivum]|uniref:CFEM domain-containing protein n=1 Tax=Tuber aestivum TaxID=59557 RepID=A0A292Q894_9PEZI|nr:unnamed protein product [Tuber aestivum]
MHFLCPIFIIAFFFTLSSSAQNTSAVPTGPDLKELPSCAVACSVNAFASMSGCQPDDYPCMCRNQNFVNTIGTCMGKSCSGEDLKKATAFAKSMCGSAVPTEVSGDGVGGSANATATISTTATSGTATTTAAKATTTTGAPNSAAGIRPDGFALGAGLLAFLAL